jgi:O-succinylbenzoic acid--CoA ligase
MKVNQFHKDFKLNDRSFPTVDELLDYAKLLSNTTENFLRKWFSDSAYVQVKTSGSTGNPKLIQLKKEFMKNSAKATGQYFKLFENTTALLCMSTEYIAGKMMLVRALELGWNIDIVKPESNPLKNLDKVYDFSAMVPMQLQHSLTDIHKVKKLIVGGGIVSQQLESKIQSVSTQLFATFGMTETITHIALKRLNNYSKQKQDTYQTLPNVSISIDNRNCLIIKAPKVSEEEIITNDVVKIVSETEFTWLGRFDNVINSGGVKLHPEIIEKKLVKAIHQRCFVAGIPDDTLGEKLILIVEGKETKIDFTEVEDLTKYELPKHIYFVDEFVETETKKIQRSKTLDLISL